MTEYTPREGKGKDGKEFCHSGPWGFIFFILKRSGRTAQLGSTGETKKTQTEVEGRGDSKRIEVQLKPD